MYIEIENKLIGPLTLKQFLYLLGGAAVGFFSYLFLAFWLWLILFAPVAVLALAFAFYKPNGLRFERVFLSAVNWFLNPRYYFWQKEEKMREVDLDFLEGEKKPAKVAPKKKVYNVKEIANMLDKG